MDPLPPHETRRLPTRHLGRRLLYFPQLDSTNSLALALASDPANDGLALLAGEQTAGRGQYGRTWAAPAGSSVLLSVLLFPPPALRRPALLTAWAAVCVCETLLQLANLQAKIKWPNDVLIRGKKVCGILIEQRTTGRPDVPVAAAVGMGLNVQQSAEFFEKADLPEAGSLASLSETTFETRLVAESLIAQLDSEYTRLLEGDTATLQSLWKWRLGLLGKPVVVQQASERHQGRLLDVTFDALILETGDGTMRIVPEQVRHIEALV